MRAADQIIDLGPGPGEAGGRVLYQGPAAGLAGLAARRRARPAISWPATGPPRSARAAAPGTGRLVVARRPQAQSAGRSTSSSVSAPSTSSRACRARANPRWSVTSWPSVSGPAGSARDRMPTAWRSRAPWAGSSRSTSPPSAGRPAPIRRPTRGSPTASATSSPPCPRPGTRASARAGSRSTSPAAAARRARAPGCCRSACISWATSTSSVPTAKAAASTTRRWPCATAARSSTTSSR